MTQFETENQYYLEFLRPLILNCRNNIQEGGTVCINISDKIIFFILNNFNELQIYFKIIY